MTEATGYGVLLYKWPVFQLPASLSATFLFTIAISHFSFCQLLSNNNRNLEKEVYE